MHGWMQASQAGAHEYFHGVAAAPHIRVAARQLSIRQLIIIPGALPCSPSLLGLGAAAGRAALLLPIIGCC